MFGRSATVHLSGSLPPTAYFTIAGAGYRAESPYCYLN